MSCLLVTDDRFCSCLQLVNVDPENINGALRQLASNQWLCLCCQKVYTLKDNARKHIRVVHLKEKKFSCDFCGHKSATKFNHNKHLEVCKAKPI